MSAGAVLGGAPLWVYALLAGLVALGIRRLKTREVPLFVALIPVIAFLIWSIAGAIGFAALAGSAMAASAWLGGALLGVLSSFVITEPRAVRLPAARVRLPGTWLPLILYMTVFIARFACGAWAAIVPAQAITATAIGVAIGAAMTGRLLSWVWRWEGVPNSG